VGYEEGGQLTESVRRRPYQVILLDEIEKAHSDVFNILLQVLDDGRLTDGQGRTVDFRNAVIVMTSNVGSQFITAFAGQEGRGEAGADGAAGGEAYETMRRQILETLRLTFRPEFLNRVDEVIVFHALTDADLTAIVDLLVADLERRLAGQDLTLELTPTARSLVASEGHDPAFGARPLKRAIQRALLEGRFTPGDHILADADPIGGLLTFRSGERVVVSEAEPRDARASRGRNGQRPEGRAEELMEVPGPGTRKGSKGPQVH
jgi:ATP-dependent Clp protease ATP-binding subunit ClpA